MKILLLRLSHLETVEHWYGCTAPEVELVRAAYRADPEAAGECFEAIARSIALCKQVTDRRAPA